MKNYVPPIAVIEYVGLVMVKVPDGTKGPVALFSVTVTVSVPSMTSLEGYILLV
jgi:hypothetical protein